MDYAWRSCIIGGSRPRASLRCQKAEPNGMMRFGYRLLLSTATGVISCRHTAQPENKASKSSPDTAVIAPPKHVQKPAPDSLIVPGNRIGAVTSTCSMYQLQQVYGAGNVHPNSIPVGE